MTSEDASYYAETLEPIQRKVILLCSREQSWGYRRLAKELGVDYEDVQRVGWFLQSANLATVETVRRGNEFAGSAIFLNKRGEQVREAALHD